MNITLVKLLLSMRAKKVFENIDFKRGMEPRDSLDIGENSVAMIHERLKEITQLIESTLKANAYGEVKKNIFGKNSFESVIEQQYRFKGIINEGAYFYIGNSYNPREGWYLLQGSTFIITDILDYSEFIPKLQIFMNRYKQI